MPFISICIPAYKNAAYLKRLMDSISVQTFRDFEVIVSDDSNDDEVKILIDQYAGNFPVKYLQNRPALGSPGNWNNAIRLANGDWIKMMHDDDWFSNENSLLNFAQAAKENPAGFIFSGFCEIDPAGNLKDCYTIGKSEKKMLQSSPYNLFRKNFIGHPSTTLIKNQGELLYDENLKWVVDIEFYMRYLGKYRKFFAIEKPLINIGLNEYQITKSSFRNPAVEIPENLYLFHHLPKGFLKNVFAYDYYWRLMRNLKIRRVDDLKQYSGEAEIPDAIRKMILFQSKFPHKILKNGLVNKSLMMLSYLRLNG